MTRLPLLLGSLFPLLAGALLAQGANDPSARAARISYVSGSVSVQPSGDTDWSQATLNYPMTTGDRLFADQGGRAELQVGAVAVRLADASDLTVTYLSDQLVQLGLAQGTVRVSVYQLSYGDTVEVDTPYGALTLLAPGDYRIDAPAGDGAMLVTVERGSLEWAAGGVAQTVGDGQAIRVSGVDPIQVTLASPAPADGFERWSTARDGRLASSRSAQYVSRDIPGYDDLDDAGTWQQEAQYGPVWYPAGVSSDWAPYRNGSWVWVEPWGWTWVDQEPWGYAPFHYGRWVNVNSRWGWLPGPIAVRSYYAPALVVFVNGSSFGAQAWFPLGPGETYYPSYHHDDDYFRRVNVTNMRNVTSVTVDVNVNAINYRNRERATTVVATADFQSGQHVGQGMMPGRATDVARAPIQPHPAGAPSGRAAAGGPPAPRPPEVTRPVFVTTQAPRAAPHARPDAPLVVPRTEPTPHAGPIVITRRPPPDVPHVADRRPAPAPAAPAPAAPAPDRAVPAPDRMMPVPLPAPVAPTPAAPAPASPAPKPDRRTPAPDRGVPTPNRTVPAPLPTPVAPRPNRNVPSPARAVPEPNRTVPAPAPTPMAPRPNRNVPAPARVEPTPNRNAPMPAAPAVAKPDRGAPTRVAPAAAPNRAVPTPAPAAAGPNRAAPTPNANGPKRRGATPKPAPDKPAPKPDSTRGPTH
jgi:hypothetical protein